MGPLSTTTAAFAVATVRLAVSAKMVLLTVRVLVTAASKRIPVVSVVLMVAVALILFAKMGLLTVPENAMDRMSSMCVVCVTGRILVNLIVNAAMVPTLIVRVRATELLLLTYAECAQVMERRVPLRTVRMVK